MTDIFVEDGLHLNAMGNLIWGSIIRAACRPQSERILKWIARPGQRNCRIEKLATSR